jgi:hypothetical protein
MEVPATTEDIVKFYTDQMAVKGWQKAMSMIQGPMGVLQLTKGSSQIMMKTMWDGQKSKVTIVMLTQ